MDPLIGGVSQDIVEVYDPGVPPLAGGVQVNTVPGGNVSGTQTAMPTLNGSVSAVASVDGNTFNQTYAPVTDNRQLQYAPVRGSAPAAAFTPPSPLQQNYMPALPAMQAPDLNPNFGPINIPQMGDFQRPQQPMQGTVAQSQYVNSDPRQPMIQIGGRFYPANSIVAQGDPGLPQVANDGGGGYPPVAPQRAQMDYSQATQYISGGNAPVSGSGAVNWQDRVSRAAKVAPQVGSEFGNNIRDEAIDMNRQLWQQGQRRMAPPPLPGRYASPRNQLMANQRYNAGVAAATQYNNQQSQQARSAATGMTSSANNIDENNRAQARLNFDMMKEMVPKAADAREAVEYMDKAKPLFPPGSPILLADPDINRRHLIEREQIAKEKGLEGLDIWPYVYRMNYDVASNIAGRLQRTDNANLQGQFLGQTLPDRVANAKSRAKISALTADFLGKVSTDRVAAEAARRQYLDLKNEFGRDLFQTTLDARAQNKLESAAGLINQDLDNNLAIINSYRGALGQLSSMTEADISYPASTPEDIAARKGQRAQIINALKSYGAVNKETGVPKLVDDAYSSLLKSTHPADPANEAIAAEKKQAATQAIQAGVPKLPKPVARQAQAPPPPPNRLIAPPEPYQVRGASINPWGQ